MRGRDLFKKYKPVINFLTSCTRILPQNIRRKLLDHYRRTNGKRGLVIRYILLKTLCEKIGDNVSVHPDVYIFNESHLEIGDNVSIHPTCYIDAVGGVKIGNDVSIAHRCSIISFNHRYDDLSINIKDQSIRAEEIQIGNNVWIGANCCLLAGAEVKDGCVIGAGTLLALSTEENSVYAGIMGTKISTRN